MSLQEQFSQELLDLYMHTDFEVPPITIDVGQRNILITDFDGVYEDRNTKPLYQLYYEHISDPDINPAVEMRQINLFIEEIYKGVPMDVVSKKMCAYLRLKGFNKHQDEQACKRAADDWKPSKRAVDNVLKIKKRGYSIFVLSGSRQKALELIRDKVGFEEYEIYGTPIEFDENGLICKMDLMLGVRKPEKKRELIGNARFKTVTDDLRIDYMMTIDAELSIIAAEKDETISQTDMQLYLYDKRIRDNLDHLDENLRKYEYSSAVVPSMNLQKEKRIIEFTKIVKRTSDDEEFLTNLRYLRNEFSDLNLFSYKELNENIAGFEAAKDSETQKKLKSAIFSALRMLPEFVNTEAFEVLVSDKRWN